MIENKTKKKILKTTIAAAALAGGYELGVAAANNYGACLPRTFDEITPSNIWFPLTMGGIGLITIGLILID